MYDRTIVVVDGDTDRAENLKELIEFMDAPAVIATPADWRERLGDKRLDALFVGADLPEDDVSRLLEAVGEYDRNVPIVMLNRAARR